MIVLFCQENPGMPYIGLLFSVNEEKTIRLCISSLNRLAFGR